MPFSTTRVSPARELLTAPAYLASLCPITADLRIAYGSEPSQWIDLYLPSGSGSFPVVVLVHGGCWSTAASATTMSQNAADLAANGVAAWTLEYRRIGEPGGGYPGMYADVAAAVDRLGAEAGHHGLDLERVVVVGHSAGAQLATWIASRSRLPAASPLYARDPLRVRTVIALSGPNDLRRDAGLLALTCAGMSTVDQVAGPSSPDRSDPLLDTSPFELLPLGVRTVSMVGVYDDRTPPYMAERWRHAAADAGDDAETILLPDAGHFDIIDVRSAAWRAVRDVILLEASRPASGSACK